MDTTASDPRYPVGKFAPKPSLTHEERSALVAEIARLPEKLVEAVAGLTDAQLDTPYREEGWTVRQVVHHIADSHMNAFIRFRLGLTEDRPTIKPYNEKLWADFIDTRTAPVDVSLTLIEALHERWCMMLESLTEQDFARRIVHPESGEQELNRVLQLYAWHGRHHTAHITRLRASKTW